MVIALLAVLHFFIQLLLTGTFFYLTQVWGRFFKQEVILLFDIYKLFDLQPIFNATVQFSQTFCTFKLL